MWDKLSLIVLVVAFLSGCASVSTTDGRSYHTLGIAKVKECTTFEGREDNLVKQCIEVKTDAFSGWEAIMNGAADAVIKILTLGLVPV